MNTYGLYGELATMRVNCKVTKLTYDVFGNLTRVEMIGKVIEYIAYELGQVFNLPPKFRNKEAQL